MSNHQDTRLVLALLSEGILDTEYGEFLMSVFHDGHDQAVVLSRGDLENQEGVICRIHSECISAHVFAGVICDCKQQMEKSQQLIVEEGRGLIIYLAQEGRGCGAAAHTAILNLKRQGVAQNEAYAMVGFPNDVREYDIAAKIIQHLGIKSIKLISSNANKKKALEKREIRISDTINLGGFFNPLGPATKIMADEVERGNHEPIMKLGEKWILTIGDLNTDYVIPAERIGRIEGQILVKGEPDVGGTAFNASLAFKRANLNPVIFGKIGDDREGLLIQEEIEKQKITTLAGVSKTKPTGSCYVIFEQATQQRLMIQEESNSNDYDLENLEMALQLCQPRKDHYIFLVGHFLTRLNKDDAKRFMKPLTQTGARLILDIVPHNMYEYISLDDFNDIVNGHAHVLIGEYNTFLRFLNRESANLQPDESDWTAFLENFESDIVVARSGIGNISHQTICKRMRPANITIQNAENVFLTIGEPKNVAELRGILDSCFGGQEELDLLCSDLGINPVNLQGQRKVDKVHALILYCNEHKLLPPLIARVRHEYPQIVWPNWLQGHQILEDKPTGYERLTPEQKRGFGDALTADFLTRFHDQIPEPNSNHVVFLSYSHEDTTTARRIHRSLLRGGLEAWIDETGITPGAESWVKAIEEAIIASKCLLVILSPGAKVSPWVRAEMDYAGIHKRKVFPVLARGDETSALPLDLSGAQYVDVRDDDKFDEQMAQLISAIQSHVRK